MRPCPAGFHQKIRVTMIFGIACRIVHVAISTASSFNGREVKVAKLRNLNCMPLCRNRMAMVFCRAPIASLSTSQFWNTRLTRRYCFAASHFDLDHCTAEPESIMIACTCLLHCASCFFPDMPNIVCSVEAIPN